MLNQVESTRLFIVLIPQSAAALIYLLISYILLKRKKDWLIYFLVSTYFHLFLVSIINNGFIVLILIDFQNTLIIKSLYYIISFLTLFGYIFLLLFIVLLYKTEITLTLKHCLIIILIYGAISILLIFIPDSISFNIEKNWNIQFSFIFMISVYIFFTLVIFIPMNIYSIRIYLSIEDGYLKKRFKYFLIGVLSFIFDLYGAILYNTWHNPIYRNIWSIITFFLLISSAILIYYGIVKNF